MADETRPLASVPAPLTLSFRPATARDCADLVIFADMATRRLASHQWGQTAAAGQSALEVGRRIIRHETGHYTHYSNWRIAEIDGEIVGACNSSALPPAGAPAKGSPVVQPLNELKAVAAGTWYLAIAAIHAEHQGRGFGQALLTEAERLARQAGHDRLTLLVGSFNHHAHGLYRKSGFAEWERRAFVPFPGSDEPGEWILMVKDMTRGA